MKLHRKTAVKLVGKKVDSYKRLFGYYPLLVFARDGDYYTKNAVGVCCKIPDSEEDFNCYDYDFVCKV